MSVLRTEMFRRVSVFIRVSRVLFGAIVLSTAAPAQFNNPWVTFAADQSRIRNANGTVHTSLESNTDEKHFAVGDFNQDGWTDVVIVCKSEASFPGMRRGYLLMNENGNLVDRTSQYA